MIILELQIRYVHRFINMYILLCNWKIFVSMLTFPSNKRKKKRVMHVGESQFITYFFQSVLEITIFRIQLNISFMKPGVHDFSLKLINVKHEFEFGCRNFGEFFTDLLKNFDNWWFLKFWEKLTSRKRKESGMLYQLLWKKGKKKLINIDFSTGFWKKKTTLNKPLNLDMSQNLFLHEVFNVWTTDCLFQLMEYDFIVIFCTKVSVRETKQKL